MDKYFSQDKRVGSNSTKDKRNGAICNALISTAFQDHITKQLRLDSLYISNNRSHVGNNKLPVTKNQVVKAKVDTGLNSKSKKSSNNKKELPAEKEFVLNKNLPNDAPTLAEKYGLVPRNLANVPLDENQWSAVKEKYIQREDYKSPCVICKEELGAQQQVLLSCSHTFHRSCLEKFENFSGKKCCPMCRKERYQARVIHDAARHFRNVCAAKIQAAWRGYLVRKWYVSYRKLVPPQDPNLRKAFFHEKLSDITNRIVSSHSIDTDEFFSEIDKNLLECRQTFKCLEETLKVITEEEWQIIKEKALKRESEECSICMMRFKEKSSGDQKPIVLLSCTHLFHDICLKTFEELNFDKLPTCPECRSVYKKQLLKL